ncbi:MAG: hypothetical protein JJ896_12500 [Rhodothermales bacterium]|nr:hypothetical protein [Rhodothermales bacterium]MBO6780466.1 hypothetical protein [Rhodothermales bacterium]
MDIQRINSASTAAANQGRTEESQEARQARDAARAGQQAGAQGTSDAIDLQSAVRESPELTAARAAMRNLDTLDDARRAEIQSKIQNGYYSQPETIAKVADAMADALQSGKKSS